MKIIYVTSVPLEYNSSANIRNRALILGLQELGHTVSTLSLSPQQEVPVFEEGGIFQLEKRYFIKTDSFHARLTGKKNDNRVLRFVKKLLYSLRQSLTIYDARARYLNHARRIFLSESYDLMISSSDPKSSHLLAEALLSNNANKIGKWIQYWGDPFALDINLRALFLKRKAKHEEERLLNKANAIIYVSPFTYKANCKRYPAVAFKCKWVPPPYQKERYYVDTKNEQYTLLYAGNYYSRDRNLLPLIEAVTSMLGVRLLLIGETDMHLPSNDNIKALGRLSYEEVLAYEEQADVLVCVLNRKGTQIPGKVYQSAGTNRNVMILYDQSQKTVADFLGSYDRFVLSENNKEPIIEAIQKMKQDNQKKTPQNDFAAKKVAQEFLQAL